MADEFDNLTDDELRGLVSEIQASELSTPSPSPVPNLETSSEPQIGWRNRLYMSNLLTTPEAKANYLGKMGYEAMLDPSAGGGVMAGPPGGPIGPIDPGILSQQGKGDILGTTREVLFGLGKLPGATLEGLGMSLGGLAGGEALPVIGAPAGAGAGAAIVDQALSRLGTSAAGIPDEGVDPAIHGQKVGMVGDVLGKGLGWSLGALQKQLAPIVNTETAHKIFNKIFKVPDKTLGAEFLGQADEVASGVGGVVLENGTDEVYSALHSAGFVERATFSPEPVQTLGKLVTDKLTAAGEVKGSLVNQINAKQGSETPLLDFKSWFDTTIDDVLKSMNLADETGTLVPTGEAIKTSLKQRYETFSARYSVEARKEVDALSEQLAFLKNGGKFEGKTHISIDELKSQLAPLESKASDGIGLSGRKLEKFQTLKAELSQRESLITSLETERLKKTAIAENPAIPFKDLDELKVAISQEAAPQFAKIDPRASNPEGLKNLNGALSQYVIDKAKSVDGELATGLAEINKTYSLFSDAEKLITPAIGETMKEAAPGLGGFSPRAGVYFSGKAPFVHPTFGKTFSINGYGNTDVNAAFRSAAKLLPSVATQPMIGGPALQAAAALSAKPAVRPIFGATVERSVSSFLASASAQDLNLESLKNGMIVSTLVDNGVVSKEQAKSGVDLESIPPEIMQQVQMSVGPQIQMLSDAAKFGGEEEVGAALSQMTKKFPELFPAPKTGIKGEVEFGGAIKLYDPMDRARYATQIQNNGSIDWEEKADIVSELNSTFTAKIPKGTRK